MKSKVEHSFEAETEVLYALRQLKGFEITLLRYAVRSVQQGGALRGWQRVWLLLGELCRMRLRAGCWGVNHPKASKDLQIHKSRIQEIGRALPIRLGTWTI
jgi:hypothetical protein